MKDELRSVTLVDQLEKKLLEYIDSHKLKAGDPLPSELFFAEKYQVSRNLVRESLSRLKMLNIVESRRKRGMVIKQPDPLVNFVKVANPNLLSERSMLDLIELRYAMEVGIVPMIFRNITAKDVNDLEELVKRERYFKGVKVPIENEMDFHTRIYRIVDNQILESFQTVILPIFEYSESNFSAFYKFNEDLKKENKLVTHTSLLERLKVRDEEGYRKGIENHLNAYLQYVHAMKQQKNKKRNPGLKT